jgi:2-dehydro-3-deoxyphosphooctonate aldolase (KDO 8-P synthase)
MKIHNHAIGGDNPLFFIAGPCVVESEAMCLRIAAHLSTLAQKHNILIIFKASYDKANRSSGASFRGPGMEEGLRILEKVRTETGLPLITDVHSPEQVRAAAHVVDVLQTPAFLARQTDLIEAAAASGRAVNFKKAQFMSPPDMVQLVHKARGAAERAGHNTDNFLVCERGTSFGYHNLVVDMRGLVQMRATACPVVFDATHSVQLPGANGTSSGGQREFIVPLARAAAAVGVAGIFFETHPDPAQALSDGPNALPLQEADVFISQLLELHRCS